jgi:hypothetical protein
MVSCRAEIVGDKKLLSYQYFILVKAILPGCLDSK